MEIVEKGQLDKYTKTVRIIYDNEEIAEGKVYLADEQEAKIFKQKLKKKIKEGDPYSVRIIFKKEDEARRLMEQVRQAVSAKYSQVDGKQVFLLVERNGKLEQVR
ncbi:MAG: hypothetical protein QXF52_02335 [Thermoproteota archaeon]